MCGWEMPALMKLEAVLSVKHRNHPDESVFGVIGSELLA